MVKRFLAGRPGRLMAAVLLSLAGMTPAAAADFTLRSDTLLRFFERDSDFVAPAYEYLRTDIGNPESSPLTFHLYGWGRADLAGSDYFRDDPDGELLYGYLQYRAPVNDLNIQLGRLYVFEGVANDSLDGIKVSSDLTPWFSLSAYGGWPVALDSEKGRQQDRIYGGRLGHHFDGLYEMGVSYQKTVNDAVDQEESLGLDLAAFLPGGINLTGFSAYNLDSENWGEHFYEARLDLADFQFRPFFEFFRFEDYFRTGVDSANPFRFLALTQEELTVLGGDLTWRGIDQLDLGLRFKNYSYDSARDPARFYSGLATWHGSRLSQVGGEIGYLDGDRPETRYLLTRVFFFRDQVVQVPTPVFVSGDAILTWYDKPVYGKDFAAFFSLGAGSRFLHDALTAKLSVDYSDDPYFDTDLRGLLTLSYSLGL